MRACSLASEEATHSVQNVSEKLSQHVLRNYDKFVAGVGEVASVERDLEVRSWSSRWPHLPTLNAALFMGRPVATSGT